MKSRRILFTVAAAFLLMIALLAAETYRNHTMRLKDYYSEYRPAFEIPDITNGFIPQGIGYDEASDQFFLTGYMGNLKASPIYVIDRKTGRLTKTIKMAAENGRPFRGHAGGLSVYNGQVCIAGSTKACIHQYAISDLLRTGTNGSLPPNQTIDLKRNNDYIRTSFLSADDALLFAGEFHRSAIFYTHRSHTLTDGDLTQKAYLAGFRPEASGELAPACVYSIPDGVQGACFADGYLFLSQAHGLQNGTILAYSLADLEPAGLRTVLGTEVPCYVLTAENAAKTTAVPPMPEEIIAVDDALYLVHESASNRYRIGRSMGLDHVIAVPLDHFKEDAPQSQKSSL